MILFLGASTYMAFMALIWLFVVEAMPDERKETLTDYLFFSLVDFPIALMVGAPYLIVGRVLGWKAPEPPE